MALITFDPKLIVVADLDAALDKIVSAISPAIGGIGAPFVRSTLGYVAGMAKTALATWLAQVKLILGNDDIEAELDHHEQQLTLVFSENAGTYLAGFASVPAECKAYVTSNPEVIRQLKARKRNGDAHFTQEQQSKILGNIDWLKLLEVIGPIIFKILMAMFL